MTAVDETITLDLIRPIVRHQIEQGQNPTGESVRKVTKRGSAGTIGALVKVAKHELLLADRFDLGDFSPEFKAAVVSEMGRFVKNADTIARQEAKITEEMFQEVCAANEAAEKEIAALKVELASTRANAEEKTRKLDMELAGFRERLSAMEEVKLTLTVARDEAVRATEALRDEVADLKAKLALADAAAAAERTTAIALQKRLADCEKDRESAVQTAALAEQKANHAETSTNEQRDRASELRQELVRAREERERLETRNADLQERLAKAETRAAVAESRLKMQGPPKPQGPPPKRPPTKPAGPGKTAT